jgi:amino acid adenylation domain-containing protein
VSAQESKSETVGFRLSPQQDRLLGVDDSRSVVQCAAVLAGPVRESAVRAALEAAIARHEILRTTFPQADGMRGRSQVIHETLVPEWTSEPNPKGDVDERAAIASLIAVQARRGFDLERGPLLRALLLAPSREHGLLILTAHAACADAASLLVILDELAQSYGGGGEPDEPVQYADYAEWRHELITGEDDQAAEGKAFWRRNSEDRPAVPSLLFATAGGRSGFCAPVSIAWPADELARVRGAAATAGVPVAVFLEACWHALVARLSGAGELMIAGWCDGRAQPDLERALGPYAQPVPIRSRLQADTSFAEILDQVARARAEATSWQDLASAEDLSALRADTACGFIHLELERLPDPVVEIAAINPSSDAALLLASRSCGEELSVELWHDPAAHGEQDAAELAGRLRTLVASAASDPDQPVVRLTLTEPAEREQLIAAAAGPAPGEDARTPVHHLFERTAHRVPGRPAVAGGGAELSYGQLNAAANRLAHLLRAAGVAPGVTVGLCMERTPKLLEAVLAILKAGGAYVPLNYEHPAARLSHQLSESRAAVLVTEEHLIDRLPEFGGEVVCVDRDAERVAAFPDDDPEHVSRPEDLVYVMYTSGSTGLPKGVGITHGNLANYAAHMAHRLGADADGDRGLRFGVVSAISTDLGNTCIFPPLTSGGCVALISPGAAMDGEALSAEVGAGGVDVLKITPSHLRALISGEHAAAVLPRRWLVLGGEALAWDLVDELRALSPTCAIINHYGPTETTIGCCAYEVQAVRTDSATVPIGQPLPGVRAYVLDPSLAPLPAGVAGELCIAGLGVASGYVGTGEDAASAFIPDRFSADGAGRMYRTGDRARCLRDGAIEFLGRIDDQVKIRGFRIEPGEIETALRRHGAVRQAAVVPEHDDRGETRLVAYIATSAQPSVEDLHAFLADSLPDYMIPSAFATLESLPFTPSGKIDRRTLSGLAAVQTRREAEYVAPRDDFEQEIAGIWAELLGIERVGVFDDFFALGGHSLLATQAIMRIRRLHGDISLRALLAAPTVATLAEVVRTSAAARR